MNGGCDSLRVKNKLQMGKWIKSHCSGESLTFLFISRNLQGKANFSCHIQFQHPISTIQEHWNFTIMILVTKRWSANCKAPRNGTGDGNVFWN